MEQNKSQQESIQKLAELIRDIDIAMLTTAEPDGSLRSRPMSTQKAEFDGRLWFLTEIASAKTDELQQDQHVNLSYADRSKQNYVSVSGVARVYRDRAKAEELWSPFHKAWFPKGVDDPNLGILEVHVDKAEYWDSPSSKMIQLYGLVKALATGKKYDDEGIDHEKVSLRS